MIAKAAENNEIPRLLLTLDEVAESLAVCPRTVSRLVKAGEFPPPVKLGRAVRWSTAVVHAWSIRQQQLAASK